MNYRHHFHAGNVADVFKHIVLLIVLESLRAKDKPFAVIDTHAGSGLYRLKAPGEFEQGIGRLWPARAQWPDLQGYMQRIAAWNTRELKAYPGSPLLIADMLRAQDAAVFIEQQSQECAALRDNLRGRSHIAVHQGDGLAMLPALVPPRENRGLVLIDPPYEQPDEFEHVGAALRDACRRWRNGTYLLWYPIKARRPVERLHDTARTLGLDVVAVELLTLPEDVPQRLNGSGMLCVNPPWKLDERLRKILPALAEFLAGPGGAPRVRYTNLAGAAI